MRFLDAAIITVLPVLVPVFEIELEKMWGIPIPNYVADISSKKPTHEELAAFLKEEMPEMRIEPFNTQGSPWTFSKNLKVVKIFDLWVRSQREWEGSDGNVITFKCKITDTVDKIEATCYVGVTMKQIDPEDPQSWSITTLNHLKVVRKVK